MNPQYRTVICILDHPYSNTTQGLVEVLYEKVGDFYYPINEKEFFCNTNSVFITKGYEDIEEKYGNQVFEIKAFPSKNELKDGDSRYVSTIESASALTSNFACAEIVQTIPPSSSEPKISIDKLPLTSSIFCSSGGNLYGPFNVTGVDNNGEDLYQVSLETKPLEIKSSDGELTLPSYHYFSIEEGKAENLAVETKKNIIRKFIGNIRELMNLVNQDSFSDFISDEAIVSRYGSMIATNTQIRNFTKGHVRLIKDQVSKLKEYRLNKQRFERLFELFEFPELWGRERSSIMEEFFSTEKGESFIGQYLSENKESLLAEKLNSLEEEITQEAQTLKSSIVDLEDTKHKLEATIRSRKQELQALQEEDGPAKIQLTEQEKINLDEELRGSKDELQNIQKELEKLKGAYGVYKDLDKLTQEAQDLRGSIRVNEKELDLLRNQKKKISKEIEDENAELLGKLVELKPKVDMLSGVLPTEKYSVISFDNCINFEPDVFGVDQQQEILESISDQLLSYGRKLDFEDLTNVIISIAQSQFTLFSGLPGTGKTSLGKLLGKAMGLDKRLLNIPVARGWTSQRDVLGFYNTLSQSYVPSVSGLYDLLSQTQAADDGHKNSAAIILLDEFNLSQPEHYFSPFLEMADPESSRVIYTGDPQSPQLKVPEYIRFLGTINNDESVQALTPRMLDRSAIIHFEEIVTSSSVSNVDNVETGDALKVLSGNDFIQLFNRGGHSLPSDISSILDDIITALNHDDPSLGTQLVVSYRKIKAITNFYNVASPLMISDKLTALDFAVNQHIIPLINGYGEGFGNRLRKLLSITPSDMVRTRRKLTRIIAVGEQNLDTYGAFL